MAYDRKVERANPELIVMLLDDSGSMSSSMPGTSDARYAWVERYAGIILRELLARSTEMRGDQPVVKSRYYIDIISYGGMPQVWNNYPEAIEIGEAVQRFSEQGFSFGLGGYLGGTNSRDAFEVVLRRIETSILKDQFKKSFPPMVFHLTDGESNTDAEPIAEKLKNITTSDGNVLIVNAYIGTSTNLNYRDPNDFPGYVNEEDVGRNPDNLRLFRMSSIMPDTIRENLIADGIFPSIRENARLFFDVRTREMLKHTIQVVGSGGARRIEKS
jgi:hypothetical protein